MDLNKFPLWKNILAIVITIVSILYSLPNFFGEDYAVQVINNKGNELSHETYNGILEALSSHDLKYKKITEEEKSSLLIRVASSDEQSKARDVLTKYLDSDYTVALNLAPAYPAWLSYIGARPMKLGLDLRGGVRFLMEVDLKAVTQRRIEGYVGELKSLLNKESLYYTSVRVNSQDKNIKLDLSFPQEKEANAARDKVMSQISGLIFGKVYADKSQYSFSAFLPDSVKTEMIDYAMQQSLTTLRKRVNELGVAESVVQRQGLNYIIVELPGIQDTARAKDIIGKTASVEFRLSEKGEYPEGKLPNIPPGYTAIKSKDSKVVYIVSNNILITGDSITMASSGIDQEKGTPAVYINLGGNPQAISRFTRFTRDNVGNTMATVYVETKMVDQLVNGKLKKVKKTVREVINNAVINQTLGTSFQINGLQNMFEARNLALLLRSGALPAPISIVSESTIGPSLGKDNIKMGTESVIWGMILVLAFMAIYYNLFGIIADIALIMNLFLLLAVCSLIGVTLTLPGIAGIVLTLGMAVDANVLIFERIREELRNKATIQSSISAGFDKAWVTIVDANVTTLIAAVVLFSIGSGPIKGFAVTLTIGLLTSMYTAVTGSRAIINALYGGKRLSKLPIGI